MGYVHHIPGRIRIRSTAVKSGGARAASLKQGLEAMRGVDKVEINTLTGSVLIYYRVGVVGIDSLVAKMREFRCDQIPVPAANHTQKYHRSQQQASSGFERAIVRTILKFAAEIAIERSVVALAAAIL